jgi:amino-acid N-acetyltransferase
MPKTDLTNTAPLPDLAPDDTAALQTADDLPILLTEGEPIGESVFKHSVLEDPAHPEAHRPEGDVAPPKDVLGAAVTSTAGRVSEWPQQPKESLHVRVHKARLQDARDIFELVNSLSGDGTLLRRSYAEICENIRDFTVAEIPNPHDLTGEPEFLGCGALHLYGPHLAEVRSIVLYPHARGKGAGAALLQSLLAESDEHGVATTCLFTRLPNFFERFGFRVAERNAMPDKIYKDCQACPRLYACDEVAMVKGPLPNIAVLGPIHVKQPKLVQVQLTGTSH